MAAGRFNPFHIALIVIGLLIALFLGGILVFLLVSEKELTDITSLLQKVPKGNGNLIQEAVKEIDKEKEGLADAVSAPTPVVAREAVTSAINVTSGVSGEGVQEEVGSTAGGIRETADTGAADQLPPGVEEDMVSPGPEIAIVPEIPEVVVASENTPTLCSNNLDDDGDGNADGRDSGCVGLACGTGIWTWSHLRTGQGSYIEDAGTAPARVGCVANNQCVNIQGNAVDQYVFYTNRWICGQNEDFFRCQYDADLGSRQGDFECSLESGTYKWVDTTVAGVEPIPAIIISNTENTPDRCADGIDNDNDGFIDGRDFNCKGISCGDDRVIVWSYITGEVMGTLTPPERIGCCIANRCVTISDECKIFNTFYTDRWICGDINNWDRCDSSNIGARSDGGGYSCTSGGWRVSAS